MFPVVQVTGRFGSTLDNCKWSQMGRNKSFKIFANVSSSFIAYTLLWPRELPLLNCFELSDGRRRAAGGGAVLTAATTMRQMKERMMKPVFMAVAAASLLTACAPAELRKDNVSAAE